MTSVLPARFRTQVVGVALLDDAQHPTAFLAAQRAYPEDLRGLWEFPGGKQAPGESAEEALVRDCPEDLTVRDPDTVLALPWIPADVPIVRALLERIAP